MLSFQGISAVHHAAFWALSAVIERVPRHGIQADEIVRHHKWRFLSVRAFSKGCHQIIRFVTEREVVSVFGGHSDAQIDIVLPSTLKCDGISEQVQLETACGRFGDLVFVEIS